MKLLVYETNLGLFCKQDGYPQYSKPRVNGVDVDWISSAWMFFPEVFAIDSFEILKTGGKKHVGYTLKISSIANEEIPLDLTLEQVVRFYDDDAEEYRWKSYSDYQALYKETYETLPDVREKQELDIQVIRKLNIENYNSPIDMRVSISTSNGWGKEIKSQVDLKSIVHYSDIERLLTPEFLLHERPCSLSSEQVYKIVRSHIKENMNGQYASVTSDYDFCFTVKRKIAIKPYTKRTEIKKDNGRSYATPKFKTSSVTFKEVDLFEMTHLGYQGGYKGYTVINGWEAPSLVEMKNQIEHYLKALMEEINTPVTECEHCGGQGCIVQKIKTNERDV